MFSLVGFHVFPSVIVVNHDLSSSLPAGTLWSFVHVMSRHHSLDDATEPFGPAGTLRVTTWTWKALFNVSVTLEDDVGLDGFGDHLRCC